MADETALTKTSGSKLSSSSVNFSSWNEDPLMLPKNSITKTKKVNIINIGTGSCINKSNSSNKSGYINNNRILSRDEVIEINQAAAIELNSAEYHLSTAREKLKKYGVTFDSSILNPAYQTPLIPTNKLLAQEINDYPNDQDSESNTFTSLTTQKIESNNLNAENMNPSSVSECFTSSLATEPDQNTKTSKHFPYLPPIFSTTGGHSNTDHLVLNTGNARLDRFSELKRNLKRRARAMQPESRGEERWDQPRGLRGQRIRRRRIVRESDLPCAPPEAPQSGYILYLSHMTAKYKYDRAMKRLRNSNGKDLVYAINQYYFYAFKHDQIKAVREISKLWRYGLAPQEKQYYWDFALDAKLEYNYQIREFRATGGFTPSTKFMKLGEGPWVKRNWHEKNELEKELATYPMEVFKLKPDMRSEAYKTLANNFHETSDKINDNYVVSYDYSTKETNQNIDKVSQVKAANCKEFKNLQDDEDEWSNKSSLSDDDAAYDPNEDIDV